MGYTITIGELEVEKHPEDAMECAGLHFGAKGVKHESAPAFGEPTDYTNSRWPSYSAWDGFLRDVGLWPVFYRDGHLIGGHPGVRLITADMKAEVDNALERFVAANPNLVAQFEEGKPLQGSLCRLQWFKYWIDWALENCETPVIANS